METDLKYNISLNIYLKFCALVKMVYLFTTFDQDIFNCPQDCFYLMWKFSNRTLWKGAFIILFSFQKNVNRDRTNKLKYLLAQMDMPAVDRQLKF